jgi:phosphoglycolate phosphatase-like HAD superfamily hydrolase
MTGQGSVGAVIFDIGAWVDAFGEFGHPLAFGEVRRQIGKGGDQLMPVFLSEEEIDRTGKAIEQRRGEIFKSVHLQGLKPAPGVRALFQRLLADGRKIALASSAKAEEISVYARMPQIEDLIDSKTSSDDADESKPHSRHLRGGAQAPRHGARACRRGGRHAVRCRGRGQRRHQDDRVDNKQPAGPAGCSVHQTGSAKRAGLVVM